MAKKKQGVTFGEWQHQSSNRHFRWWWIGIAAAVLIGWMAGRFIVGGRQEPTPPPPVVENPQPSINKEALLQAEIEQLNAELKAHLVSFRAALEGRYSSFVRTLPPYDAERAFAEARKGVDLIASKEGFCGWKVCCYFAYKMGYDKLKGTHKFEESVRPHVDEKLITPMGNAWNAYVSSFERYRSDMEILSSKFSADCALSCKRFLQVVEQHSLTNAVQAGVLEQDLHFVEEKIRKLVMERTLTMVGTALEVVMIQSTYQTLISVSKKIAATLLAKSIARAAATCTSAAAAAVVDGPLPIGDLIGFIITVGGLSWTAYDIYKATKVMPAKLKSELTEEVRSTEQNMKSDIKKRAEELFHAIYNAAGDEIVKMQRAISQ